MSSKISTTKNSGSSSNSSSSSASSKSKSSSKLGLEGGSSGTSSSSSQHGSKHKALYDTEEFLCSYNFRNTLPAVPSGPFFKKIGMAHTSDELAKYKTSTIEKSHIWHPHFDRDVNIRLDLVDQEAMLQQQDYIDPSALATECKYYLSGASDRSTMESRKRAHSDKHWWLRETVYSENYILKNRSSTSDAGATQTSAAGAGIDPFTVDAIQQSFISVKRKLEELMAKNIIESSMPIIPDATFSGDLFSFITFDENPSVGVDVAVNAETSEPSTVPEKKKARLQSNIITNIRISRTKKGTGNNTFAASMVAPLETDPESVPSGEYQNVYKWAKDYRMVMRNKDWQDHFMLVVDDAKATATFFPVGVNMDMGRLQIEEVEPHDAIVERRTREEENAEKGDKGRESSLAEDGADGDSTAAAPPAEGTAEDVVDGIEA